MSINLIKVGYVIHGEHFCNRCMRDVDELVRVPKKDNRMWLCKRCCKKLNIAVKGESIAQIPDVEQVPGEQSKLQRSETDAGTETERTPAEGGDAGETDPGDSDLCQADGAFKV